ncbi:unnamed protein product [Arctogadus glacialis]
MCILFLLCTTDHAWEAPVFKTRHPNAACVQPGTIWVVRKATELPPDLLLVQRLKIPEMRREESESERESDPSSFAGQYLQAP